MNHDFLILNIAVLGASALQSATGIGFGVIAGPILLVALNDGSAIQISILLNLLIAALLAPSLKQHADRRVLNKLLIGLVIGSPVGFLIFSNLNIVYLKAFAGVAVVFTLLVTIRGNQASSHPLQATPANSEQISIGVMSGIMGASLAMPGPIAAAWMSIKGFSKETIRATILLMFIFAYSAALVLQFAIAGIGVDTLRLSAMLIPSTVIGVLAGRMLSRHITERTFYWLLVIILASTALALFLSIV